MAFRRSRRGRGRVRRGGFKRSRRVNRKRRVRPLRIGYRM